MQRSTSTSYQAPTANTEATVATETASSALSSNTDAQERVRTQGPPATDASVFDDPPPVDPVGSDLKGQSKKLYDKLVAAIGSVTNGSAQALVKAFDEANLYDWLSTPARANECTSAVCALNAQQKTWLAIALSERGAALARYEAILEPEYDFSAVKGTGTAMNLAKKFIDGSKNKLLFSLIRTLKPEMLADPDVIETVSKDSAHVTQVMVRADTDPAFHTLLWQDGQNADPTKVKVSKSREAMLAAAPGVIGQHDVDLHHPKGPKNGSESYGDTFYAEMIRSRDPAITEKQFVPWLLRSAADPAVKDWMANNIDYWSTRLGPIQNRGDALVEVLDDLIASTSDLERLKKYLQVRFDFRLRIDGAEGVVTVEALKEVWNTLRVLPSSHIDATSIDWFGVHASKGDAGVNDNVSGTYAPSKTNYFRTREEFGGGIDLDVSPEAMKRNLSFEVGADPKSKDKRSYLGQEERFNAVSQLSHAVRHEVGHAVDDRLQWMTKQPNLDIAGWKEGTAAEDALTQAVVSRVSSMDSRYQADQERAKADKSSLDGFFDGHIFSAIQPGEIMAIGGKDPSPQLAKVKAALLGAKAGLHASSNPDKAELDGRVFGYKKADSATPLVSYSRSARNTQHLSDYQWSTPSEWFAEIYAYYFDTPEQPGKDVTPEQSKMMKSVLEALPLSAQPIPKANS